MKGVILAAGRGTRLLPITKVVDKTWLPINGKPVVFYAIETLLRVGIKEILIVTNSFNRKGMEILTKDFARDKKIKLSFKTKNHDLGMPFSILQARSFAGNDSIMVIPGDNIFLNNFSKEVEKFKEGATAFLREVKDPSRFGVAIFEKNKLVGIVEKPKKPLSNWGLIAPYLFDNQVFEEIQKLRPSKRGELEVVDLLTIYLKEDELKLYKKRGFWKDVGTFEALEEANRYFDAR